MTIYVHVDADNPQAAAATLLTLVAAHHYAKDHDRPSLRRYVMEEAAVHRFDFAQVVQISAQAPTPDSRRALLEALTQHVVTTYGVDLHHIDDSLVPWDE